MGPGLRETLRNHSRRLRDAEADNEGQCEVLQRRDPHERGEPVIKKIFAVAALIALAACHRAKVPREQFLLRLDGPWTAPATLAGKHTRSAPATIVYFRDDSE